MASVETTKASEMLADVSVQDLMAEVQRRLDCARKPEKRLILIGPPGHSTTPCHTALPCLPLSTPSFTCAIGCCLYVRWQAVARAVKPLS